MALTDTGSSWENMVLPLLQGAGTALTVVGDTSTASGSATASNFNAQINDRNAVIAASQGQDAIARQQRQAYLVEGAGRAGIGASGVRLDGSALDVLADSASRAELDKQTIQYNTNLKVMGFQDSATLDRMRADAATRSGMYKAAADALIGGAQAWKLFGGLPGTGTPIPGAELGSEFGAQGDLAGVLGATTVDAGLEVGAGDLLSLALLV